MRKYLLSCIIFAVVLIIANTASFTGTDELRSVMALGVGSVGKWIQGDRIERRPNPKDLHLYLERINTICRQKDTFFQQEER